VRDYVHVSDVADAHLSAAKYLGRGGSPQIINLGTGKGYSVQEIVNLVKKITGEDVQYKYESRRVGDPPYLFANINYATDLLQYQPKHDIISIIQTAYNWHKKNDK
jgi:UDP-glucose 4-epimerase